MKSDHHAPLSPFGGVRSALEPLWLTLLVSALSWNLDSAEFPAFLGDLDGDDQATVLDLILFNQHLSGGQLLPADTVFLADLNDDGNVDASDFNLMVDLILGSGELTLVPLPQIESTSPANGEDGVAITRETIIRFDRPLAPTTTVGPQSVRASFANQALDTRIQLSADRQALTLFYTDILPSSARIRVSIDGSSLLDERGYAVDVDGDGQPGGKTDIQFDTLGLTIVPGTAVCGRVFASQLSQNPGGEMSVNRPLAGVVITVDGQEDTLRTVTDSNGDFRLDNAPAGRFFVHIDGRSAVDPNVPAGSYYPFVGKTWESIPGQEVNVGEVYLPLVQDGTLQEVSDQQDTMIGFPADVQTAFPDFADVQLTVPAGALFSNDGTVGGRVGIAPVPPDRLPGELPENLEFPLVITVQTDGPTNFNEPVPICFPNTPDPVTGQPLAPGEKTALWSFNHDTGAWEVVAPMTVSADGSTICTDPGTGILAPGWHGRNRGSTVSGGGTRDGRGRGRSRPRPTGSQECAQDDCPCPGTCSTSRSVFLHSGEEVFTRTDLHIPGRAGMDFLLRRVYRSQMDYDGPMGFGWSFEYSEGLYFEPNGDVVRYNGRNHEALWAVQPDGSYTAPAGYFSDLERRQDGTYVLTESSGFQRWYREDGRLFCHQDRFGNRMLFDYDAHGNLKRVIDVYGREITFTFQPNATGPDRLTSVTDFAGRTVTYGYDSRGDLVSVTSPSVDQASTGNTFPEGRTERYTYSSGFDSPELNHNLLSFTAPEEVVSNGPPRMQWVYGSDPSATESFDRVIQEIEGGTNDSGVQAGGTMTIVYEALNQEAPLGDPDLPRGKATVTERNGTIYEYFVNERQLHILTRERTRGFRDGEPAFYETRSFYNSDGQLLRREFPEGNAVTYRYDSQGPRRSQNNLLEVRMIADADRSAAQDIVTTYTYEPLFNQVATIVDPRGNDATFTPSLGTQSQARYTTRFFYDYQESNLPVEFANILGIDLTGTQHGLGDLNEDSRTDQAFGNLVRIESPTVTLRADAKEAQRSSSAAQPVVETHQWNDRGQLLATIDPDGNVMEFTYHPESDPDGDGNHGFSIYTNLTNAPIGYLASMIQDSSGSSRRDADQPQPTRLVSSYLYDSVGNAISVTDPRGVRTDLEINTLNEIVSITRGANVEEAINRDQLPTGVAPFAFQTRYIYDHNGRVIGNETENRDGTTEGVGPYVNRAFDYDILDNLIASTVEVDDSVSLTHQYRYDGNDQLIRETQPEGNASTIEYDERNLVFRITRGAGSPDASTVQYDYDLNGNRRQTIDAEDNNGDTFPERTTYIYDGFDRLAVVRDALGNERRMSFDPVSNTTRVQVFGHPAGDPLAAHVALQDNHYHFDELNRAFQIDEALFVSGGFAPNRAPQLMDHNNDGMVTTFFDYDAGGRLRFVEEDDRQATEVRYDGADRAIESIDALGNRIVTDYDHNSNATRVRSIEVATGGLVPPQVFTTLYVYDQLNRLSRMTDNAGQTTRYQYDSRNNLIAHSDPVGPLTNDPLGLYPALVDAPQGLSQINLAGNTVTHTYDGLDRRVRMGYDLRIGGMGDGDLDTSNPENLDGRIEVGFEFDGNSRLVATIDDNGARTEYTYDALDRRRRLTFADGGFYQYDFDRDDNLRQQTDPNGTTTTHNYDAVHRLVETSVNRANGILGATRQTYAYDGLSRMTMATDDNGNGANASQSITRVFDSLSRLIEETQNGRVVSTSYSGDSKRVACVYPNGRVISQSHDAIDRVTAQTENGAAITEYQWIGPNHRCLLQNFGNGVTLSYLNAARDAVSGYDGLPRPTQQRWEPPVAGAPLLDRGYTYNRVNIPTQITRGDDENQFDTLHYDSNYRLTSVNFDQNASNNPQRERSTAQYTLDGAGNRRSVREANPQGADADIAYSINALNQYTSIDNVARTHSDNGNLLSDGIREFAYDFQNRLVQVTRASDNRTIARYEYDATGRRRKKTLFDLNSGAVSREVLFFYDGLQVCEEQTPTASEVSYVYSPRYPDELAQMTRSADHPLGAGTFYSHADTRFDAIGITDAAGTLVEKRFYDDFGAAYDASKTPANADSAGMPYGFQGRRLDSETGLYYFRTRMYDPQSGRFLQRDPVWDAFNHGNVYAFGGNSPAARLDPLGLDSSGSGNTQKPRTRTVPRTRARPSEPPPQEMFSDDATTTVYQTGRGVFQGMGMSLFRNSESFRFLRNAGQTRTFQNAVNGARYVKAERAFKFAETFAYNFNDYSSAIKANRELTAAEAALRGMSVDDFKKAYNTSKMPPARFDPDAAAKSLPKSKVAKAAAGAGTALQVAEIAGHANDAFNRADRINAEANTERDRILQEYDRLSRAAMEIQDECRRDRLLRALRENMEYQLNNATEQQKNEVWINAAVFARDSLATFIPLPTGWLWGNQK